VKKVAGHVVITSGFSEVGNTEGERELLRVVRETGGRVIGPNVVGILLNGTQANASFAPYLPYKGKTCLVSQSGALLIALDVTTYARMLGCSAMVSLGNMSDLDFADAVRYFDTDPGTACISMYIEGLKPGKGRDFITAGRESKKPVIVLKAGVSAHGAAAAASHTGSLAGSTKIYEAAFNQANMVRAATLDELLDSSQALSMQPPMRGDNVVVITNGGGIGVLSTDAAELYGIPLKTAPKDLQEQFFKCMPPFGSPKNPVDITGGYGAKGYEDALNVALAHPWVNAVAILYCETAVTKPAEIGQAILRAVQRYPGIQKPVVVCFVGGDLSTEAGKTLNLHSIPVYANPEKAMCSLAALRKAAKFADRGMSDTFTPYPGTEAAKAKALAIVAGARKAGRAALTEIEANEIFAGYNIPVARVKLAKTEDEAAAFSREIGFPVVLKVVSPQILHKSDAGGVVVGVKDEQAARAAFQTIRANCLRYKPDADIHGILVAEMAAPGKEVIVGSVKFGMGGVFVEVLKDVTFRVAPVPTNVALEMVTEIKSYPILAGVRGEKPRDTAALADVLSRISQVVFDLEAEIAETDANPILVYEQGKGLKVVDNRIILKKLP
jgi:acetyltransferase